MPTPAGTAYSVIPSRRFAFLRRRCRLQRRVPSLLLQQNRRHVPLPQVVVMLVTPSESRRLSQEGMRRRRCLLRQWDPARAQIRMQHGRQEGEGGDEGVEPVGSLIPLCL